MKQKNTMKTLLLILTLAVILGACQNEEVTPTQKGQVKAAWSACGRWDKWSNNGYTVYNNIWGTSSGWQCIWANSGTNWGINAQLPSGGGVKSYPNSYKYINKRISSYNGTGSWNFSIGPNAGWWNASFDIWVPSEVMVWVANSGGVGPIGSLQQSNVSIGGHTWNVYRGGNNVVSFVRTSNSYSGSVNLRTMIDWGRNKGWYGDGNIGGNSFGFEIFGNTSQAWYNVNSMSIGS
jgi:hypothetical protein